MAVFSISTELNPVIGKIDRAVAKCTYRIIYGFIQCPKTKNYLNKDTSEIKLTDLAFDLDCNVTLTHHV